MGIFHLTLMVATLLCSLVAGFVTVQTLEIDAMDETAQAAARQDFESRWNRWNSIRTVLASLVTVLLIILLLRL